MTNEDTNIETDVIVEDTIESEVESTEDNSETQETTETENPKDSEVKPKRTPQEELKYFEGRAKRLRKQLGIEDSKETKAEIRESKSELGYGEKAFLRSYDIKGADEIALVKTWLNRTGDALDSIVEDEIFKSKLAGLREAKKSLEAVPKGNKRSSQGIQDESYWIAKINSGQASLNDIEDTSLRRNVLNKKIEYERTGSKFSQQPIVKG